MDVTLPDGTVVKGIPEGTTKAQLATKLKSNGMNVPDSWMGPSTPKTKNDTPKEEGSLLGGIGEEIAHIGTSMFAKPIGEIASMSALAQEKLSPTGSDFSKANPRKFGEEIQQKLTYEPKTQWGEKVSKYNPLQVPGMATDWAGKKVSDVIRGNNDIDSTRGRIGSGVREAFNQAPNVLLPKFAAAQELKVPARQAALDIQKGLNLPKDTIRNASQEKGLTTPIEGTSWVTGIPGISKVDNWISSGNQPKINQLVAENFNLPKGVALTKDEMSNIRAEHNAPYIALENFGKDIEIKPPPIASKVIDSSGKPIMLEQSPVVKKQGFQTTDEFTKNIGDTLNKVTEQIAYDPETFSGLIPSARSLRQQLRSEHDPKMTMRQITQLRKDANTMFKSDDPTKIASAFTNKFIADQLENMIEANLEKTGQTELLNDYRKARKIKAQTYDVESALDNTGNVDARKLYTISKKKPLTDNLKIVADYAGAFPEGAKKVPNAKMAMTPWDWLMAGGSAVAHNPLPIALDVAGRVGIPKIAEKGLLQKRTPDYKATNPARMLPPLAVGAAASRKPPDDNN